MPSAGYRFPGNVQVIIHADTRRILDPGECVSLLPWWLRRTERGGTTLVPGRSVRHTQPVDVRDVAGFALSAPPCALNIARRVNATP